MIITIPNFIRNVDEIMFHVYNQGKKFIPRVGVDAHSSLIPGVHSQFKTLKTEFISGDMLEAIFADSDFDPKLKDTYSFIQIQKYDPGDYIAPHHDTHALRKIHLVTLTSSDSDGLVCEDVNHVLRTVYDRAGQYIDIPYDAAHYVSPVKNLRYSMVIGE